jgi:hypothetical protein
MTPYGGSSGTFDRDPVSIPELVFETFGGLNQDEVKPLLIYRDSFDKENGAKFTTLGRTRRGL